MTFGFLLPKVLSVGGEKPGFVGCTFPLESELLSPIFTYDVHLFMSYDDSPPESRKVCRLDFQVIFLCLACE